LISIFNSNKTRSKQKRNKKSSPKRGSKSDDLISAEKLDKINPMAVPLLVRHRNDTSNKQSDWIESSLDVLLNKPYVLTDKWINSINKWTDSVIQSISLDEPDIESGFRGEFGPYNVYKICDPKDTSEYPMPAIICLDENGWKWYFKTSKAYNFNKGDDIRFTATVSAHKEGITFLRRPSKIRKVEEIKLFGSEND
jgi:hypothetical protein